MTRQWVVTNCLLPTPRPVKLPKHDHKVTDLFLEILMKISVCQVLVAREI